MLCVAGGRSCCFPSPYHGVLAVKGGAPMALVSYGFWQQNLGGTSDFQSKHLTIDNRLATAAGIVAGSTPPKAISRLGFAAQ